MGKTLDYRMVQNASVLRSMMGNFANILTYVMMPKTQKIVVVMVFARMMTPTTDTLVTVNLDLLEMIVKKMTLVTQILVLMTEFASPVTRKGVNMKLSAIAKKDIMATFVGLLIHVEKLLV